ncbi:MAG TPA: hypothetical protein VN914_05555 [Polyangia bacterium]|nr:hypothetical protein [Polyangia bacterium]
MVRFANIVCVLTIVLAVFAMMGTLLNADHFTWLPILRGLPLIIVALVARSRIILRAKAKRARQSEQATTEQLPRT